MQIIKVEGINGLGKTKGCEKAPIEILKALGDIRSSEKGSVIDKKLFDFGEIEVDNNNVEEANQLIYENAKRIMQEGKVFFLGGDHSITYSLVSAFKDSFEKPLLIVFDAHADCMPALREPTHEEWLRALVEKGFPTENIILIAVRNLWPEERVFLEKKGIKIITMKQIQENKQEVCDLIMERAKGFNIYVSIDIDAVDPGFAPAVGYQEPGGLGSREMIYFLQRLSLLRNFKAADIVEINPDKDPGGRTVKLGAKLLAEML